MVTALIAFMAAKAGGTHVTLAQIATIFGLAAVAGTAVSIFLQKGLRDALQTSRDNVEVLLQGRDISKAEWDRQEKEYVARIAKLEGQNEMLQSDVLKGILNEVTAATANMAASAVKEALKDSIVRDPSARTRQSDQSVRRPRATKKAT